MTEIDLQQATVDNNKRNRRRLDQGRENAMFLLVSKANGAGAAGSDADPNPSNKAPEDPFYAMIGTGRVIEPPFDMLVLSTLPEQSSELNQCVEAMQTNIDGTGHRYISRLKLDDLSALTNEDDETEAETVDVRKLDVAADNADEEPAAAPRKRPSYATKPNYTPEQKRLMAEAAAEKVRLTNFFTYATDESFSEFRQRLRRDYETTGNYYFEVLRNSNGEIQGFCHVPSFEMRLGKSDEDANLVDRKVLELQMDGSVLVKTIKEWKRFRKFVQCRFTLRANLSSIHSGGSDVWYKEFGDARQMDKRTGEFVDGDLEARYAATEIVHGRNYAARSPYGLPRYIGNLLAVFGDRASEEINYTTFKNNNIPSMAVIVSNGQLTDGSIKRINSFVETQIRSSDNYSKFLIIEAESMSEEGEDGGQIKVDIKPLTADQHKDALFQEYSKNNHDKIRRAFRLPPLFVGRSDDYSKSVAESSRRLADEQVFAPERDNFDSMVNRILFPDMGVKYHKFKSNSPNTTDNEALTKILADAEKTGGMTPRIARAVLEQILGIDLPELPADFPADVPFSLTMAEAVKNMADPAEPGQQVTALKALSILKSVVNGTYDDDDDDDVVNVAKKLLYLNKAAEIQWRKSTQSRGDAA